MTLQDQARTALDQLPVFSQGLQVLQAADAGERLAVELVSLDSLASAFDRLLVESDALAGVGMDRVQKISEDLSKKLNYLLEPIAPVEADADRCVVQLRSNPPDAQGDRTTYYELLVSRGGELSLCRYSAQPGQLRRRIPAQVTREVLLRLIGDFQSVL